MKRRNSSYWLASWVARFRLIGILWNVGVGFESRRPVHFMLELSCCFQIRVIAKIILDLGLEKF